MDGRRVSNRGFGSDFPCPLSCQPQARETHTGLAPGLKQNHFQGTGCPFGYNFMIKKNPQHPVMPRHDGKLGKKMAAVTPHWSCYHLSVQSLLLSSCLKPPGAMAFPRTSASTCTRSQELGPSPSQPWTGCAMVCV